MFKAILDYQNAFNEITQKLKKNTEIVAIFVFGSMVTGDLWEGSDIDLLVVHKEEFDEIRGVYSHINNIPIHMKFLSKESFKKNYYEEGQKGVIKKTLTSSKLIYSIDSEITELYQKAIYVLHSDKGRWNLVYLSNLLREIGICRKYLKYDGYTAYELVMRALKNFSKLYLSMNEYTVSKDSLSMACNLNDDLNDMVKNLFDTEKDKNNIIKLLEFMEYYLKYNIQKASRDLIEFLKDENKSLSAYEIKNHIYFKNFNIRVEQILKALLKEGIVEKSSRELNDSKGNLIIKENVYNYKNKL